ncbi:unnamed protein product, partial [Mesorhabditis belari]|uniref:Uncharacterized protein n=1 Tax=Mesorhabditis belari TaxID=2138241 RepID=A0AAF3EMW8_9BILA
MEETVGIVNSENDTVQPNHEKSAILETSNSNKTWAIISGRLASITCKQACCGHCCCKGTYCQYTNCCEC